MRLEAYEFLIEVFFHFFLSAFQKATLSNCNQSEIELGDQDLRYFYQTDSPDILNLESAVTETPYDIQLWLKLASKKLNNPNR